jgi:hypothetical protein
MAVCIVGAGRTLSSSLVFTSIPNISSTSETQGLLQGRADLFVHVSVGGSNVSRMRDAIHYLQPINYVLEDGRGPYPTDERVERYLATPGCHRQFWDYPCGLGKAMNYHHHIKYCHSLVERHEVETKLQYDVIMFARSDLQWFASPPSNVMRAAAAGLPQIHQGIPVVQRYTTTTLQNDFFMVAPRSVAKDLATMLDDYYTANCDFRGSRSWKVQYGFCKRWGYCSETLPEEIVFNAATLSGAKNHARVDYTFQHERLYKVVRAWAIPKDSYKAVDNEDYLEEIHGRSTCAESPGGSE